MRLRIKTQDTTLSVDAESQWTIARLINIIRDGLPSVHPNGEKGESKKLKIRLVYQGHLLDPDTTIFDSGLVDDSCVHCMVTEVAKKNLSNVVIPTDADAFRGFGLLRNAGYSDDDVEAIRLTYFASVEQYSNAQAVDPMEDPHHRWIRMEEAWMRMETRDTTSEFYLNVGRHAGQHLNLAGTSTSTSDEMAVNVAIAENPLDILNHIQRRMAATRASRRMNTGMVVVDENSGVGGGVGGEDDDQENIASREREGTIGDFVVGFALGLLLGVIMMFWLGENSLSKRQKAGVVCGVLVNVVLQFSSSGENKHGPSHLRGSNSTGKGNVTWEHEARHQLIPVVEVAGKLPLGGVGSVHYNARTKNTLPERFG
jgi:hypothetical protein